MYQKGKELKIWRLLPPKKKLNLKLSFKLKRVFHLYFDYSVPLKNSLKNIVGHRHLSPPLSFRIHCDKKIFRNNFLGPEI